MYVRGARDGEREGVDCKVGAGEWGNDEGNDGAALAPAAPSARANASLSASSSTSPYSMSMDRARGSWDMLPGSYGDKGPGVGEGGGESASWWDVGGEGVLTGEDKWDVLWPRSPPTEGAGFLSLMLFSTRREGFSKKTVACLSVHDRPKFLITVPTRLARLYLPTIGNAKQKQNK